MPRLTGYRSRLPDLAERKLEQLGAVFRQSIRARDNRTNREGVNRRDFGFDFSSAKEICHTNESPGRNSSREIRFEPRPTASNAKLTPSDKMFLSESRTG
jgi:hypothetical protein